MLVLTLEMGDWNAEPSEESWSEGGRSWSQELPGRKTALLVPLLSQGDSQTPTTDRHTDTHRYTYNFKMVLKINSFKLKSVSMQAHVCISHQGGHVINYGNKLISFSSVYLYHGGAIHGVPGSIKRGKRYNVSKLYTPETCQKMDTILTIKKS